MAKDAATLQIPATVQAVLAARIDRLPPEARHLLQTAAVIGVDVPFALLRDIAGLPEEAVSAGLARLQATEFLYEANFFPELEYAFTHALTHEVAYGSLPQARRRAVHARIVEAIETQHRDRLGEHIERLAHHALRGELREKAVDYLRQAGGKAVARVGAPRRPGLVRAGARCPRGAAGERVRARAGLRNPPRATAGAGPARSKSGGRWSACARPRPSPSD